MPKWRLLLKAGKAYLKGGKKAFLPGDEKQREVVKESLNTQDVYIQGGAWIYNDRSKVTWSHIDESPEDHAAIDELLKNLRH